MTDWKGFGRKQLWFNFYPSIHPEGLRKNKKTSVRIAGLRSEI
jgi:hypothetical protein